MRSVFAIIAVTSLLVGAVSVLWGWPGMWLGTAFFPGILIGLSVAHVADARVRGERLRLGFVMMGLFLGALTTLGSVSLMRAVSVPAEVKIERTSTIDAPREIVWDAISEPLMWTRWDASIGALEAGAEPTRVGAKYDSTLLLHGQPIPTTHVLTARETGSRVDWSVEPRGEALLKDLVVSVRLVEVGATTQASYTVEYRLPDVHVRGFFGGAIHDDFETAADGSLRQLASQIEDAMAP